MFSAQWTQSDPEDSQSISIQVWRCLLGQYHPHTWHSLAFLWEPGQRALGFDGAERVNSPSGVTERRAEQACHIVPRLPGATAPQRARPGQGIVLWDFCLPLKEELPPGNEEGLPSAQFSSFHMHATSLPPRQLLTLAPALFSSSTLFLASKGGLIFSVEKYFKYRTVQKIIKSMNLTPRINKYYNFVIFVSDFFLNIGIKLDKSQHSFVPVPGPSLPHSPPQKWKLSRIIYPSPPA